MAIYRFTLNHAPNVSLGEQATAHATSEGVRMALSVHGFEEHVMWPAENELHAVFEGDDPDALVEALDAFSGATSWTDIRYVEVPEPDDDTGGVVGARRTDLIVRSAIEQEGNRCDFCQAIDPPPHMGDCPYAKRDYGIAEGPGGFVDPSGSAGDETDVLETEDAGSEPEKAEPEPEPALAEMAK